MPSFLYALNIRLTARGEMPTVSAISDCFLPFFDKRNHLLFYDFSCFVRYRFQINDLHNYRIPNIHPEHHRHCRFLIANVISITFS